MKNRKTSHIIVVITILLIGIISTVYLYFWLIRQHNQKTESRFEKLCIMQFDSVEEELERQKFILQAIKNIYNSDEDISREEFRATTINYLSDIGIQALEWIPQVSFKDKEKYINAARTDGYLNFEITVRDPVNGQMKKAPDKDFYFPVYYLEPLVGNEKALGYDLSSHPSRKKALNMAADTGEAVATEPIRLVQENESQYGFLIFLPVYYLKNTTNFIQLKPNLKGFILGVYRIENLIRIAKSKRNILDVEINAYDVTSSPTINLTPNTTVDSNIEKLPLALRQSRMVDIAGRKWKLVCQPNAEFFRHTGSPKLIYYFIFASGLLSTIFLSLYIDHTLYHLTLHESQAKRHAADLILLNTSFETAIQNANHMALEAELANKTKHEFISSIAREVYSPMHNIVGMIELIDKEKLNDAIRDYVDNIRISSEKLLNLFSTIKNYSVADENKINELAPPFSLNQLLQHIIPGFKGQAGRKGLELNYAISPEVPDHVIGDQHRIAMILVNLVSNAIKFTEAGSISVNIDLIELQRDYKKVKLAINISDTGIGIPEHKLKRLFEFYYQSDLQHSHLKSSGLGLAISRRIAESMNGKLTVDSEVGLGSTFKLVIPFLLPEQACLSDSMNQYDANSQFSHKNILIVDNDEICLKSMIAQLSRKQYTIYTSTTARAALETLKSNENIIDAIVLSKQLPDQVGTELCKRIRALEAGKNVTIIGLTVTPFEEEKKNCLLSGMDFVLTKPPEYKELLRLLHQTRISEKEQA